MVSRQQGSPALAQVSLLLVVCSLLVLPFAACSDSRTPVAPRIQAPVGGSLDTGESGAAYTVVLSANGAPATWSVIAGQLPAGLILGENTGILSGMPTQTGTFVFTVRAVNDVGSDERELSLVVEIASDATAPEIATQTLPDGAATVAYSTLLLASGTGPVSWSVGSGSLPAGLALGASTGVLAGTPSSETQATFTVVATNPVGSDTQELQLTIAAAPEGPSIQAPGQLNGNTAELPEATVDAAYSQTFTATGTAPILWTVSQGQLPAGLSLGLASGVLSGTPTQVGSASFTVAASNPVGSAEQACTLEVISSTSLTQITPATAPLGSAVVLTGTGFDATTASNNQVKFDAVDALVLAATATTLRVEVPAGISGTVDVTVTVDGTTTSAVAFDVSTSAVGFVDADATSGTNNGTSWRNAWTDLTSALARNDLDEIWIAEGTYLPGTQITDTFGVSDVRVYGGFAGDEGEAAQRDPVAHPTILSGDLNGDDAGGFSQRTDNSSQVVQTTGTVVLSGLVLEGGESLNEGPNVWGGGLFVAGGSATVRACTFRRCRSRSGGGLYSWNATLLLVEDSVFADCHGDGVSDQGGAAVLTTSVSAIFRRVVFSGCSAENAGAVLSNGTADEFHDCLFVGNSTANKGGGLFCNNVATIRGCTFYGNSADQYGGAALLWGASDLYNCIFRGNTAVIDGPQLSGGTWTASPEMSHCNLEGGLHAIHYAGNVAWSDGGGIVDADPNFADSNDPDGADDRFGTADDGLILVAPSTSIDGGTTTTSTLDLRGASRSQGTAADLGAYESTPSGN